MKLVCKIKNSNALNSPTTTTNIPINRGHGQTHAIGQIKKVKDLWIEALVKSRTDENYSWTFNIPQYGVFQIW